MKDDTKIEKRRKFHTTSAIGGFATLFGGIFTFSSSKAKEQLKTETKPINVKIHPLAVQRNKKG